MVIQLVDTAPCVICGQECPEYFEEGYGYYLLCKRCGEIRNPNTLKIIKDQEHPLHITWGMLFALINEIDDNGDMHKYRAFINDMLSQVKKDD